jgi:hypothetical protein
VVTKRITRCQIKEMLHPIESLFRLICIMETQRIACVVLSEFCNVTRVKRACEMRALESVHVRQKHFYAKGKRGTLNKIECRYKQISQLKDTRSRELPNLIVNVSGKREDASCGAAVLGGSTCINMSVLCYT